MSLDAIFLVEPLDPAKHRRESFDCGVKVLNDFFQMRARKEMDSGISATFVMVPELTPSRVAGFYTLSAATIKRSQLPENLLKSLPRYPELPATLLGRLARSLEFRGQRIGDRSIASALTRAVEAARVIASWAVVTDPKDDNARDFYAAFGFRELTAERLFLPMKDAAAFLRAQ